MRDDLRLYYERELTYIRQMGVEFAQKYPKIASRLVLEADKCEDPHVERLLESFAFLAARVHLKIDDEFPEITEALLSIVYPHYIRPIPSMSIVEFVTDPSQANPESGLTVDKDAMLYSRPVGGVPCKFRTCYKTTLWPLSVTAAEWKTPDRMTPPIRVLEAAAAVRVELKCEGDAPLNKLQTDSLRFFLNGESNIVNTLYELLSCNIVQIMLRDPTPGSRIKPVMLPQDSLRPVGFAEDEGMLPYPKRSFIGYRLLVEYFTFPEKFFFFDLNNLRQAFSHFKDRVEIVFLIREFELEDRRQLLELGVSAKMFKLGCTPIVNLFPQTAEPILLTQRRYEHPIVPDVRRPMATEIFSVDQVVSINPQTQEVMTFQPFYSYRHAMLQDKRETFWIANRRPSGKRNDEGSDLYMSMVDLSNRPVWPDVDTLTIRTTCTNRDLPSRLPFGSDAGDFELEGGSAIKKTIALKKPTNTLRPPAGKSAFWRLISQLSLNYLSLVEDGKDALQEILKLYNFTDSAYSEQQIKGITQLRSQKHFARVISENGISFARGVRVDIEFDEEQFVGGGVYLFASVLEHFLGMYASLNSFSQLVAASKQRRGVIREWQPRAGRRILM
ncbi:MAG TPA: type VI secretion system baseplate subunit TssF [Bryobacteraceae bacterium]|nr:type VI secretion system baseplate subunit TssF [Bryobacteraceae bacterium]